MLPALTKAIEHEDMTEKLAEMLTTRVVDVKYKITTGISFRD